MSALAVKICCVWLFKQIFRCDGDLVSEKKKKTLFLYNVLYFAGSLSTTFGKIQNLDRDEGVPLCQL